MAESVGSISIAQAVDMISPHSSASGDARVTYQEITPHAVALGLENDGSDWRYVQARLTHLFNSDLNDYEALMEKLDMIQRTEAEWNARTEEFMREELKYQEQKELQRKSRRLILSNVAADAEEDDIRSFFAEHGFCV